MRGLRAHLGLWHAALMAITLLALAGLTYALLIRVLHSRADAALEEYGDITARQMAATLFRIRRASDAPRLAPEMIRGQKFLSNDIRTWGRYVQIVDTEGFPREWSDGLASQKLPVSADALARGKRGLTTLETVRGLGEHPVRIVTVPVRLGADVPLMVQAGTSLEGVEAALQRAGWLLLIITPLVFLLALVGNWIVVDRALRRVDDLTRLALEIQSSNLERRIRHGGPVDEIGRLAHAFDQMISRLDKSFRQVRQFSADASHELRTPLTAIRGEAEVALLGELTPEQSRKSLGAILDAAERMSGIVESLLLLARADAGQALIKEEPVEIEWLVEQSVRGHAGMADRAGVALVVGEVAPLVVAGDPLWLSQALGNLVSNGIKYTPPGGRVTVSARQTGEEVTLEVRDSGIGIAEEHLPHIFERFYRVDSGRARAAGGSGLGLSITRWAVEAHGGGVAASSSAGEGSAFTIRLPLPVDDRNGADDE